MSRKINSSSQTREIHSVGEKLKPYAFHLHNGADVSFESSEDEVSDEISDRSIFLTTKKDISWRRKCLEPKYLRVY
ncbi:hypothetical protein CEXT_151201 [Caerostris extrusa]|uniref:Uncharacterized protein n=1 Tax=Caerostris extrusa TaxID=172846 RepID=A0AAV4XX65_CAEEX|nr:hypothetical protein CEXT_151201 [Caerostris extrusa]